MSGRPAIWAPEHAAAFADAEVAAEYFYRAPYPSATFDVLMDLLDPECAVVLDVGTGTGSLARPLASAPRGSMRSIRPWR